jgi:hypothetical protein
MKLKRRSFIIVFLAVCVFIGGPIYLAYRKVIAVNREAALSSIWQDISLGDSQKRVRDVYGQWHTYDMQLREVQSNAWVVQESRDWTATPSDLYIDFTNSHVSQMRMRFQHDTNLVPAYYYDKK